MGTLRHLHRHLILFAAAVTALAFLFFASTPAFSINPSRHLSVGGREMRDEAEEEKALTRRRLHGPGSSPPSCISSCGVCTPCEPVHVPIHPGFSMKLEYYPEAWRCKCKDKLFMP